MLRGVGPKLGDIIGKHLGCMERFSPCRVGGLQDNSVALPSGRCMSVHSGVGADLGGVTSRPNISSHYRSETARFRLLAPDFARIEIELNPARVLL